MVSRCPSCGSPTQEEERLCSSCGWDFVTHKRMSKPAAAPPVQPPQPPVKPEPPASSEPPSPPPSARDLGETPQVQSGGLKPLPKLERRATAPLAEGENPFTLPSARDAAPPVEPPAPPAREKKPLSFSPETPPPAVDLVSSPPAVKEPGTRDGTGVVDLDAAPMFPPDPEPAPSPARKRPAPPATEPRTETPAPAATRNSTVIIAVVAGAVLGTVSVLAAYLLLRPDTTTGANPSGTSPFARAKPLDPATSLAASFPAPAVKPQGPSWTFEGVVFDLLTARGVSGAKMIFVDADGNVVGETETGSAGRYKIALPPGIGYELKIEHDNYAGRYIDEGDAASPLREATPAERRILMRAAARNLPWVGNARNAVLRDLALVPRAPEE